MKNKKVFIIVGILFVFLMGFVLFRENNLSSIAGGPTKKFKDATYTIEGKNFTLKDGISEILSAPVEPGGLSKTTTKYFGNEIEYDFNKDKRKDVAFILTQNKGGSGTFYYVVFAVNTKNGYVGSNAFLLGDRIAPQTTEMSKDAGKEDVVIVNFADRDLKDSFAVFPSVGKSIRLKVDINSMQFSEDSKNI